MTAAEKHGTSYAAAVITTAAVARYAGAEAALAYATISTLAVAAALAALTVAGLRRGEQD